MAVKTEKQCFTEHLERVHKFDHEKLHNNGVAEHGHYHPAAGDHRSRAERVGASHHGNMEKHDSYTPEEGGSVHYHTHPHTHADDGPPFGEDEDPFAALDAGVSSSAYSEHLFLNLGAGGDALAEMGGFLDTFVS